MNKTQALEQLLLNQTLELRVEKGSLDTLVRRSEASDEELGKYARPTGLRLKAQGALVEKLEVTVEALADAIKLMPEES